MSIKVFTHNDLDGAGSVIVLKNVFDDVVVHDTCTYRDAGIKIGGFSDNGGFEKYDHVCFTDLDLVDFTDFDIVELLESHGAGYADHHPGSLALKNAGIDTDDLLFFIVNCDFSATYLLYRYFTKQGYNLSHLNKIVKAIDDYDTWSEDRQAFSRWLNYLYYKYWSERFVKRFKDGDINLKKSEIRYIKDKERELKRLMKTMDPTPFLDGGVKVISKNDYVNELLHHLLLNSDCEVAININPKSNGVSLRTRREDIDLGCVAENHGGGGHPQAAGLVYTQKKLRGVIEDLADMI